MTHTILLLNGPALTAFGGPVPGLSGDGMPMLRQPAGAMARAEWMAAAGRKADNPGAARRKTLTQ